MAIVAFEETLDMIKTSKPASEFSTLVYKWGENERHKKLEYTGHRRVIGKATSLIKIMKECGAMHDEINNALCYAKVAFDSFKYDLNYKRAAEDLSISYYIEKYYRSKWRKNQ